MRPRLLPRPPRLPDLRGLWRRPASLTFEQFVYELALLGLKGAHFGAERYAGALARRLGAPIQIDTIADYVGLRPDSLEAKSIGRELAASGHMGLTKLLADGAGYSFRIVYLDDLDWWLREHTLFHELGHVAAGHFRDFPLAPERGSGPVPYLADRPPARGHGPRESEANLRANYAMLAGSLGELSLRKESLNILS